MEDILSTIERYKDQLYRFVLRNVWDRSMADDVFASAVLAAYENRDQYIPGTNFRAWMFKILANKCFIANRETQRTQDRVEEEDAELLIVNEKDTSLYFIGNSKEFLECCGEEVYKAFQQLSTAQRTCILLKDVEGFSYKEIADILGIPVATVMTHLSRGRAVLRRELLEYAQKNGFLRKRPKIMFRQNAAEPETCGSAAL